MATNETSGSIENENKPDTDIDVNNKSKERELKHQKAMAKSSFTRCRTRLRQLVEDEELPSRRTVREVFHNLDICIGHAIEAITVLSDWYSSSDQSEKCDPLIIELEKLDYEFATASDYVHEYLDSRKEERSSIASDTMHIDMLHDLNISDHDGESMPDELHRDEKTYEDRRMHEINIPEVRSFNVRNKRTNYDANAMTYNVGRPSQRQPYVSNEQCIDEPTTARASQWTGNRWELGSKYQSVQRNTASWSNGCNTDQNPRADSRPSIGQDLWKQLKRVQIPVFHGDKRSYQSWKAAFIACVDIAPATAEYKLLQLRQYLSGEALNVIENLGHSAIAYEAAKERLDRKYGGKRRQIAIYLEELDKFKQIRPGNSKDIEQFADKLDIAIINLREAGHHHELGDGSLYTKLQQKIPESMLARYHRWIFEHEKSESVISLREWIIQEAEFQTIASETVNGLTGKTGNNEYGNPFNTGNPKPRAFFGGTDESLSHRTNDRQCVVCPLHHPIWKCFEFRRMSVSKRWEIAKREHLCYRCLGSGHRGNACPSSRPCGLDGCTDLHSILLHRYREQLKNVYEEANSGKNIYRVGSAMEGNSQTTMITEKYREEHIIGLRTVPVVLVNGNRRVQVNALLDDASTKTYVNADVAAELGLHGKTESVTVNVLNGQVETFQTTPINVQLHSIDGRVRTNVSAYTTNRVTGNMKVINWNKHANRWRHLESIQFPMIESRPIVDVLIGLDCADLHYALEEVRGRPGEPVARLTPLGWTCIGCPGTVNTNILHTNFASTYFAKDQSGIEELNAHLKKFWEIEEISLSRPMPIVKFEEKVAIKSVEKSIKYENGMYEVGIPWKENDRVLPNNYEMAFRRLQNAERRLQKSQDIELAYKQCIEQYTEKGYVRKVSELEQNKSKWYLPHFPVIKPDKDTTKTRIVFDASAKYDGVSLNDAIHQGPKLQRDLFDVLLRFRKYPVAVVCDIAEMYLRIGIAPEDRLYHRFLWRGMNTNKVPDIYEFSRVVFGVNSSPFQAQFVSQQHAEKYKNELPMAAETVLKSTYMDDSMDSTIDEDTAIELYKQLSQLWSKAGMHARKWMSNSARVLKEIPLKDRKSEVDIDTEQLPNVKTLGVWWISEGDVFTFKENAPANDMEYTKRNFLKKIATLFDPLGLLAPFTVRAKMLLQDMWAAGLDWDDTIDEHLKQSAQTWFGELCDLRKIQIPRCLSGTQKEIETATLHTFVDASELAYGAVVYARYTYPDGNPSSRIVASKTRVAPTIATSIPRLELMGAIVGIRLAIKVSTALEMKINESTFWSDSLNVLWWIRGKSREFKPFVANRVGEIQSSTRPDQWRYVPTAINPADVLSRGMKAVDLAEADIWWKGPAFLIQASESWPENKVPNKMEGCVELNGKSATHTKTSLESSPRDSETSRGTFVSVVTQAIQQLKPERYSSWLKLTRVSAWVNRFIKNCQLSTASRIVDELTSAEIRTTEIQLIKQTQRIEFSEEWSAMTRGKPLPSNSKLLGLQPKLDDDGLMRSDGRLKYARFLSYDVRFPVILPRRCWITKLIVKHFHELGKHASGINQTLAALSARYWVISGREVIREWEKECAECRLRKAKACKQVMAPLPVTRLKTSARAFVRTSVDFGGPFVTIQGRGKRREKRYLCLFTCLATRAVHLEVANGLDTDSFLNAFYRMSSRRGLPEEMMSDNGTNFKSADRELKSLVSEMDENKIKESIANKGVNWTFNPPLAPHFGGVHETMIKSAKKAISAILGNADITDEELLTAVIGAEALINSRPLTYQSADPSDDTPLTPNHFLHGQMGGQFAPQIVDSTSFNPRKRWRRIQELVRHFWHRWLREWLPGLTARKKWFVPQKDVQVGDVMLVISPETSRGNWPLGRVLEVYPGQDGRVRVAKIQIGQNAFMRPISKLCPLECNVPSSAPQLVHKDL